MSRNNIFLTSLFFILSLHDIFAGTDTGHGPPGAALSTNGDLVLLDSNDYAALLQGIGADSISKISDAALAGPLLMNGYFQDERSGVEFVSTIDWTGVEVQFIESGKWSEITSVYGEAFKPGEQLFLLGDLSAD